MLAKGKKWQYKRIAEQIQEGQEGGENSYIE